MNLLSSYAASAAHRIVGLMSGTSVDGIDAVLVELSGQGRDTAWRILQHTACPLPGELRLAVLEITAGRSAEAYLKCAAPAAQIARLDVWLADAFAQAALACIREAGLTPSDVDAIASHGQTVCHLPDDVELGDTPVRATLQLGRGAVIAEQTGLPVVSDFRSADMAAGGQGAPLVPYADWVLFSRPDVVRVVQNLGGIGNVTYLPGINLDEVIAFDTGPANMLIDAAIRHLTGGQQTFDRDGEIARTGVVSPALLQFLLSHPYLEKTPPRSTGHEDFGEAYFSTVLARAEELRLSSSDLVATLTAIGPETAVDAYRRFLPCFPDEIILGGGGSLNPVVIEHFQRLCPGTAIRTAAEMGIPAQAKEPLAFAFMANETLLGNPSTGPSATGASHPVIAGCVYLLDFVQKGEIGRK